MKKPMFLALALLSLLASCATVPHVYTGDERARLLAHPGGKLLADIGYTPISSRKNFQVWRYCVGEISTERCMEKRAPLDQPLLRVKLDGGTVHFVDLEGHQTVKDGPVIRCSPAERSRHLTPSELPGVVKGTLPSAWEQMLREQLMRADRIPGPSGTTWSCRRGWMRGS